MPHLTIEYTSNLVGFDPAVALRVALDAARRTGLYDMATAKARACELRHFAVDRPDTRYGFVATTFAILPGRTSRERQLTSEVITEALVSAFALPKGTQVTTEVREMESAGYTRAKI